MPLMIETEILFGKWRLNKIRGQDKCDAKQTAFIGLPNSVEGVKLLQRHNAGEMQFSEYKTAVKSFKVFYINLGSLLFCLLCMHISYKTFLGITGSYYRKG